MNTYKIIKGWKHIFLGIMVIVASVCVLSCKKSNPALTAITEKDVKAIIHDVEQATKNKDIDGVIRHLAPFVVITVSGTSPDIPFSMNSIQLSRDQYKEELRKLFTKASRHDYRHENETITIREDGKAATVESDLIEYIVMGSKEIRSTTREKAVMEIIDGEIMVTVLDAVVTMEH
jgi:hypothetical protein